MSLLDFLLTGFSRQIDALTRLVNRSLNHVNAVLALNSQALQRLEKAVATMATLQDLDTALDGLEKTITDGNAAVLVVVNDIVAKIGPAVDLSAEVARIKAAQQKVTDEVTAVQALDVAPAPTP